ncbi:MAG TPA: MFS transporter, partial [Methylibium sp.]
ACAVGLGLALGSVQPMVMSMLHQITPDDRHGEVLGLRMMLLSVSSTLMPLLFGGAGTLVGAAPVFWTMALFVGGSSTVARKLEHDLVAAPGHAVHQT